MPGGSEWLIIGAVVLLLFGARKLPELARSLGRSTTEFKEGIREGKREDEQPRATQKAAAPAERAEAPPTEQVADRVEERPDGA